MKVPVKSSSGIQIMDSETRFLMDRKVFIKDHINSESVRDFAQQIMFLVREDNTKPIKVYINSPGGEIKAGMMMYDIVQTCGVPLEMYCLGSAYSMAALIFASGRHGRYMLPHSELMLHEPLLGSQVGGNSSSIRSLSESLLETKRKVNKILAEHTGRTEEEIDEATSYDHFFTPEECIEFGLCDEIIGFDKYMEV